MFHYSKINMKPPGIGSVVEWHQDLSYYPMTNRDVVTVLINLDDATIENGCLTVIPGRHIGPPLDHTINGFFRGKVTEPVDAAAAVPLEGAAGDVTFMHCLTPHASVTNTSDQARRTLILSYRAGDCFPLYFDAKVVEAEAHCRMVRGCPSATARFTMTEFPVPIHERESASLYELQEQTERNEPV